MSTEIFVISGFLGAGKTTLIQKLLKEAFRGERVVLIENDFGDISVDAALLKSGGIEVKEMNSGCICCSLSGDFVKALAELLNRFHPDKIIIEPSGVGKLSDLAEVCSDPRILPLARVEAKITVADVKRCKTYLDNFGEFFEDQIENADAVLLSRAAEYPDKVEAAEKIVRGLNPRAAVFSKPWDRVHAEELLRACRKDRAHAERHAHDCACGCHGAHGGAEHDHDHAAEDVFDTVTIRTNRIFGVEDLRARISRMEKNAKGTVLRAKGIVRGPNGPLNLQYLPGELQVTECAAGGDMLCIIGRNLDRQELRALFGGE